MGAIEFSAPKKFIYSIQEKFQYSNFIETGTYMGETSIWASAFFKNVFTIEVNPELSSKAAMRASGKTNIRFINGDSSVELGKISEKLTGSCIYWLDGHWCGGVSKITAECPLMGELHAIKETDDDVVLIDDARFFMGIVPEPHHPEEWPRIDAVIKCLKIKYPKHEVVIEYDVIMCLPVPVYEFILKLIRSGFMLTPIQKGDTSFNLILFLKNNLKKIFDLLQNQQLRNSSSLFNKVNVIEHELGIVKKKAFLNSVKLGQLIDVGASFGDFTFQALEIFPSLKVIAFEPIDKVFKSNKKRFKNNKNVEIYNLALGNQDGEVSFNENDYSYSSSILELSDIHVNEFKYTSKSTFTNVPIKKLDCVINADKMLKPLLIKIDVQGFEKEVLLGGTEILKYADYLIIEVSFCELYIGQPLFEEINSLLSDLGFRYAGNLSQLISEDNERILQADALFLRK